MKIGNNISNYNFYAGISKPAFKAGYGDSARTIAKKMHDLSKISQLNDEIKMLETKLSELMSKPKTSKKAIQNLQNKIADLKDSWRKLYYGYYQRDGG